MSEERNELNSPSGSRRDAYMYDDLADYEETVGYKVNESFADGFRMARMKWGPIIDMVESDGGEIIFENMKVCDGCSEERTKDVHTTA